MHRREETITFTLPAKYANKEDITLEYAKEIGDDLGVDWKNVDLNEFGTGLIVELEHGKIASTTNITDNEIHLTALIALAHLREGQHYYTYLKQMEEAMDKHDTKPSRIFLVEK